MRGYTPATIGARDTSELSEIKVDGHVKNPFYMDLGIEEFRDCELL